MGRRRLPNRPSSSLRLGPIVFKHFARSDMEVVGGKADEDPSGDPEEQRRCRRLTLAPSVSSIEVVTVEDASDDDSETVSFATQEIGRPSFLASVSVDGASREQLRSSSQLIDAELQKHASSSDALPIGD
jgi:hypothetical protein